MKNMVLPKSDKTRFFNYLMGLSKLAAPVKKGVKSYSFEIITDTDDICIESLPTILPPKKYFMPQHETLLEFDTSKGQNMEAVVYSEPLILLGVHTCDLEGIQCLNHVFLDRPKDYHYLHRHNDVVLIGVECMSPCDSFASCTLMETYNPAGGYDLFMTDMGQEYLMAVNTPAGEKIAAGFGGLYPAADGHMRKLNEIRGIKRDVFRSEISSDKFELPSIFESSFNHSVWEKTAELCLSCGNCTNVCPTCYCFDVQDETELDITKGRRIRVWDSCQNETFAKVAGGENFREKRSERIRHRFYRKFKYPDDRYGKAFCTGCGRCSRQCMAGINLKKVLSELIKSWREL